MFLKKTCLVLTLLFFSSVIFSQQNFQTKEDLTISGNIDLKSFLYTSLDKQLGNEPVTNIEITFNVPLMKDTKKLVSNIGHIPMFDEVDSDDESTKVSASIKAPFKSLSFVDKNGEIDVISYINDISSAMGQFTASSNDRFEEKIDPIDSNCSGMPVGTVVNIRTSNCFGTTDNTYECMTVNNQNNWILTRNVFIPREFGCLPE